ncbi:unnamed protein product, partial [Polarella glacialis]
QPPGHLMAPLGRRGTAAVDRRGSARGYSDSDGDSDGWEKVRIVSDPPLQGQGRASLNQYTQYAQVDRGTEGEGRRRLNQYGQVDRGTEGDGRRSLNQNSQVDRETGGEGRRSLNQYGQVDRGTEDGSRKSIPRVSVQPSTEAAGPISDDDTEARRSVNSGRNSLGNQDEGETRRSASAGRNSQVNQDEGETCRSFVDKNGKVYQEGEMWDRMNAEFNAQFDKDEGCGRETCRSVNFGRNSQVNQDEGETRRSVNSGRNSQVNQDEGETRRSVNSGRNSQVNQDEGETRRSVNSGRSSQVNQDEGETRRSMNSGRNSQVNQDEGETRRSVNSGRNSQVNQDEGETRRSVNSGRSSQVNQDEGETRRSVNSGRNSQVNQDEGLSPSRGRGAQPAEGSHDRMHSRPPARHEGAVLSEAETDIFVQGDGWTRRSKVDGGSPSSARSATTTVVLSVGSYQEMKSILWDFSKPGCRVRAIRKGIPQEGFNLRVGDELLSINKVDVQGQTREFVESKWRHAQSTSNRVKLCFDTS